MVVKARVYVSCKVILMTLDITIPFLVILIILTAEENSLFSAIIGTSYNMDTWLIFKRHFVDNDYSYFRLLFQFLRSNYAYFNIVMAHGS